jgi:hypothetical protein
MPFVKVELVRVKPGDELELGPDDKILAVGTGNASDPGLAEYDDGGTPYYVYELTVLRVRDQEA